MRKISSASKLFNLTIQFGIDYCLMEPFELLHNLQGTNPIQFNPASAGNTWKSNNQTNEKQKHIHFRRHTNHGI